MERKENNVAVIYNNEASRWCDYIKAEVKKVDQPEDEIIFSYVQDTDMFPTMDEDTQNSLCNAKVIVVIASPGFLHNIQKDKTRQCMIQDPTNAILFLCGVTVKQLEVSGISKRFHQFEVWAKIAHEEPRELLLRIVVNVENAAGNPTPLCALKARQAAVDKHGVPNSGCGDTSLDQSGAVTNWVDPKWAFDVTPTRIRSEEQTEVVLFFHNPVTDGCELGILVDEEKLLVHTRNPYTFSFIAPEHREGEVLAVIECDDERIGDLTLKYKCDMERINGLIQIHLQALELVCQQSTIRDLDQTLSKLFDEKSGTIPVAAFENLFGMHEYATNVTLQHELPTLLHFAAKYGLKEFTNRLIDLPGALLTYSIGNKDGDRPAEIARKFKHLELANYFDTFIEMNGTLYEMIEPYMTFNIDSPCYMEMQAYYNSTPIYDDAHPVTEEMYMDMSGGNKCIPGSMAMNRPKPRLERPKTKRQEELYDIVMLLHEKKISALESQSLINGWVNKHAGGHTFKDKQQRLVELNAELKMWSTYNRESAGYYNHTNKSEFVQYMFRQLKRQLVNSGYMYATKSSAQGNSNDEWAQGEYMYSDETQPKQPFRSSGDIYEANPTSPISPKPAAPKPTSQKPATPKSTNQKPTAPKPTTPKPIPGGGRPQPRCDVQIPRATNRNHRKSMKMEMMINENRLGTPPSVPKRAAAPPPNCKPPALVPRQK